MLNLFIKSKVEISVEELLLRALQYNMKCLDINDISDRNQKKIHNYNKELVEFSTLLKNTEYPIEIHCENDFIDSDFRIFKYYFIDSTGLSHGYISSATLLELKKSDVVENNYGDPFLNKAYSLYDFVYTNPSSVNLKFDAINLEFVIKNYTPLLPPPSGKYYNTEIRENINQCSTIICTKNNQSFCLPIVELVCNKLNLEWERINVVTTLEKEYIKFAAAKSWGSKKYNNTTTYVGKISYENLEIIEIEDIGTEREYDW